MYSEGLYEQVINGSLAKFLKTTELNAERGAIDGAEAAKVLSGYVAELLESRLEAIAEQGGLTEQVSAVNKLVDVLMPESGDSLVDEAAQLLLSLYGNRNRLLALMPGGRMPRPETSLAMSSLFTGAIHEPQLAGELKKEICSCDSIDMLVSFIKWSGLRIIIDELRSFTDAGGRLRVITTSYMGATDLKAVEELSKLSHTEIRVSYDTKRTRLHAKSYIFNRASGYSTAYVGSSNLSNAAISGGLEWNVKVTRRDLPETMAKITATFESYWNSDEFESYDESQRQRLAVALKAEHFLSDNDTGFYGLEVRPYPYQQEILDKLDAERRVHGYYKNLVVAATGTGKTVIAALDFKRFKASHAGRARLLFVAHREEILRQSIGTFRAVLNDANFGELFVGSSRPVTYENLFVSVQTLNSQHLDECIPDDFYDYIVVDEFHHAAANTYQRLLYYFKPQILLGLTATPERMDGKSILTYFSDRITAEIRLPEAIDRKLLCPFQYFGVTDSVDLTDIRWSAGGYDRNELSRVYSISGAVAQKRADLVVRSVLKYVTDINDVKGIGFCVSVEHAGFMCDFFNNSGIPSLCVTGNTHDDERKAAKYRLVSGDVRFIFTVDLYNEGVDIPEINTVLFLRPTESLTVFLQQLGRGLRLCDGKDCLTVLDFIGQANRRYSFENKFKVLLSDSSHSVKEEIANGFVSVPKGCYIQLERKAAKYVLDNIRESYSGVKALVDKLASFEEDTGRKPTMAEFLSYHRLEPKRMYKSATFSRLCVLAGLRDGYDASNEDADRRALGRLAGINSKRLIDFLLWFLPRIDNVDFSVLPQVEQRMLRMFCVTMWGEKTTDLDSDETLTALYTLSDNSELLMEIIDLLHYSYDRIDVVGEPVELGYESPLELYCSYSRDQLLVALDCLKTSSMREGVKWLKDKKTDILLITLNKSEKDYSPTTMYKDYSISSELFRWQSQSTTAADSEAGKRYINHDALGSNVLLFVRENNRSRVDGLTEEYTFLGKAHYVSHDGEKPMNITWRLERPIPAKFLKKTNKLMVG